MPSERFTGLAAVLEAVRAERGITQPELIGRVGLGRSVVAQRVAELESAGLVEPDGLGPSSGGRAPRRLRLRAEAGLVLAVDIASNELVVGIADLGGTVLHTVQEQIDVVAGPEPVLAAVRRMAGDVLDRVRGRGDLWAVGIGMPGPVAHDGDVPVALPTMPGWERGDALAQLTALWSVPVWIDSRVTLLALGERRANPVAAASDHMIYLGGGAGIGAAVVSDGRIVRGARGLAGAIGHTAVPGEHTVVCPCGKVGCLNAVAGGLAISREGRLLAEAGHSPALAQVLAAAGTIRPIDVTHAAEGGDPASRALLHRSGLVLGGSLATLVSLFNPDLVVVGGGLARAGTLVLAAVREALYRDALPAATRELRIEQALVTEEVAGVTGAVESALGLLFAPRHLPAVLESRSQEDPPVWA